MALFAEVASAHSFSRAALALGIPLSTLSRQVAELERSIGLQLISRSTRRLALTDAGRLYFDRCRRILAETEIAHEDLRESQAAPAELLRVNLPDACVQDALTPALAAFAERHPGLRFQLSMAHGAPTDPARERCDVSIRSGPPADLSLTAHRLGDIRARLYAAPAYLALRPSPASPADLAAHDCIGLRQGYDGPAPWPLQRGRERADVVPRGRYCVNDPGMALRLAAQGAGIVALNHCTPGALRAAGLVQVLPEWELEPVPIYALTETLRVPARTRDLIDFLAQALTG